MIIKNKKSISKKRIIIASVLIVLFGSGIAFSYMYYHQNSNQIAKTTSTTPTAQSNYTKGDNRQNANSNTVTQGGAIDNSGKTSSTSEQSQWKVSDSGVITLKQPLSGSTLKSGDELSGAATLDKVQYRLVDNQTGVIAQGALNVVNGNFSGTLQFRAQSGSGILVIYSFDGQSREINRVEIPVTLQ
jgi:Flp pilus assembly protein TadG